MYARRPSVLQPPLMDRSSLPADAPPIRPPASSDAPPDGPSVAVVDGPVVAVVDGPAAGPPPVSPPPVGTISVVEPVPTVAPESRMLPPHQTKTERVADHVAAVSADLREWVELRIALVKRQVEGVVGILERVQHLAEAAKMAVPGVVLILIGLMFLLVTLALGIGALIGSVWGGFAIVTAVLLVAGGVLVWLGKKRYDEAEEAVAEAKRQERAQRHVSREDIETAQRRKATLSAS